MDRTLSATAPAAQPDASDKLYEAIRPAVFKIEADGKSGTGWLVDGKTLVTSYHVIRDARNITAIGQDGKRYRLGAEVTFDADNDVAVLSFASTVPGFGTPIARAETSKLRSGDFVYSVGHPHGRSAQSYVGSYERHTDYRDWLTMESAGEGKNLALRKLRTLTPELLARPFVVSRLGVTHGCSGGPVTDSTGKVVAIVTKGSSIDDSFEYSMPVEKVNAVLAGRNDPSRFEHRTGYYEMGIVTHMKKIEHDMLSFYGSNIGLGVGLYSASKLYGFSTDPMCLISRGGAKVGGAVGAGVLGLVAWNDGDGLLRSTTTADSVKYGAALASDATMAGGLATRYWSVLRSTGADRCGKIGKALLVGGALARLACEFIPNNFVVDVGSKPLP